MPYRFKRNEDLRKGFRRIAREQLDIVARELGMTIVSDKSVHAGRKALKRLRALIRCATPALGPKVARKHDLAIRDISRLLSQRRDADVSLDTLKKLEAHFGSEAANGLLPLRTALEASRASASDVLDKAVLEDVHRRLAKEGKRFKSAKLKGRGIAPYIEGIGKSYRDGIKARKAAYRAPSDDTFHELRKAVQAHWRHMSLLSRAWPEAYSARVALARDLSQLLGDDHDLAMLKVAAQPLTDAECSIICNLCERRQSELREAVKYRAELLYSEPADTFESRMAAYWASGSKIRPVVASIEPADDASVKSSPTADHGKNGGSQPSLAAKTPATSPSQRRS